MNSDNYEFSKSSAPQSVGDYSSYANKQWNYVNDINSGVYQNNGLSLVQWDLTNIYNGGQFTDVTDLYMAVPIVMMATASNGAALIAPPTNDYALCSLKSNYQYLIHQIEIVANGKVVNDMQPFISVYKNFKLLSQLSSTDLKSSAVSLGMSDCIDNEKSMKWTVASGTSVPVLAAGGAWSQPGIGLCNNLPFSLSNVASGVATPIQNTNQNNCAIYNRVSRIIDTSGVAPGGTTAAPVAGTSYNNFVGSALTSASTAAQTCTIVSLANLQSEYKPIFQHVTTAGAQVSTWQDIALIPLKHLCDCIDKMGLVKKCDLLVRAYFNTGAVQVAVNLPATANTFYSTISTSFSQTCPLTVNFLPGNQYTAATTLITAGVYIGSAPASFGVGTAISIPSASQSICTHSMKSCRMYYSQVALAPSKAIAYVEANTNKQIVYENFLFNQYSNITANSSFSQLVQSGIKNPIGVAIIPIINPTNLLAAGAVATLGFNQYASPYDTFPATYSPLSLTNLQVTLGGVNVLNSSMFYTFENFLTQVALAENLTSADIGISCGLINQSWWESNRVYWVDLGRGTEADKATSRNLNISFSNNSNLTIDVLVFTIYLDRFVLNCETGSVKR